MKTTSSLSVVSLVCIALGAVSAAAADAAPLAPVEALRAVQAYSEALNRHDCAAMLEVTTPGVVRGLDASGLGRGGFCDIVGQWRSEGVRERLRLPVASLAQGDYRAVFVPNQRSGLNTGLAQPMLSSGMYVVHSSDAGRSWFVLDASCLDAAMVRKVYPPYTGSPAVLAGEVKLLGEPKVGAAGD